MDPAALRPCPLFQALSSDQLRKVAGIARPRDAAAGEVIFQEGEPGDEMYVVVAGKVRISKRVEGVGEEALSILEPGSYFGEMAMIPLAVDQRAKATIKPARGFDMGLGKGKDLQAELARTDL